MLRVRRADKLVVGSAHQLPDPPDLPGDSVHVFLGRDPSRFGAVLNLLAMLVGTGQEKDILAFQAMVTGDRIGQDDFIAVPDMGLL